MRLGKAVVSECHNVCGDFVLYVLVDAAFGHAGAEAFFDLCETFVGAFETERTAKLFGLAARKSRDLHRHPKKLFLKKWYTKRAFQDRFERGVNIIDRLFPLTPCEITTQHLADDRARADDRDLNDEVIKFLR